MAGRGQLRRVARAIGLVGKPGSTGRPPRLQEAARRMLDRITWRTGLYVARGPFRPRRPLDHRVFTVRTPWAVHSDFVRYGITELLARQIRERNVGGCIAEVGVYQGHWARAANHHLPDRPIYLFDTFEGFDDRDLAAERTLRSDAADLYVVEPWPVDRVLDLLPHPRRAVIRQGWFPETAVGLEDERFCLVDIDVGLHDPTLAALEWFYPRMVPGGFIWVVDYGNAHTPGVQVAVEAFADRVGCGFVPLPDRGASVLIPIAPAT